MSVASGEFSLNKKKNSTFNLLIFTISLKQMNRLDRLTAILTQLQSKRQVRAQEIADRFCISLRTVYRDIKSLEVAGIPISGEAGRGYTLVEGYRLPPVSFSREEALSLLVAEKFLVKHTDKESGNHFQSALVKIKAVLKENEKTLMENLEDQIAVLRQNSLHGKGKDRVMQPILDGLSKQQTLLLEYTSFVKEETSTRDVEPIGMYYSFEQWYLIAFCKWRQDYRTFRLDRINSIRITDQTFTMHHPSLKSFLEKMAQEKDLLRVVIRVHASNLKYLQTQKYKHGFVLQEEKGDEVALTFMTGSLEGFARWIICMADMVVILTPETLRTRVRDLLSCMLENYTSEPRLNPAK